MDYLIVGRPNRLLQFPEFRFPIIRTALALAVSMVVGRNDLFTGQAAGYFAGRMPSEAVGDNKSHSQMFNIIKATALTNN